MSYSFSYNKNFKKRGHNIKLNLSWSDNNSDNTSFYDEPNRNLSQRSFQEGTRYDQSIRLDYTYPFNNNNGKIELGYKREYDKMSSQYYAEQLFDETWRSIPPSNIYDYYHFQ